MATALIPPFVDEKEALKNWQKGFKGYCRECKHIDCEEIRQLRKSVCSICHKGFEVAQRYFSENANKNPQHEECVREQIIE